MSTPPEASFSATLQDGGLQAREHRGVRSPGPCMLIVELKNHTAAPLTVEPQPLELRNKAGKRVDGCVYERAVVWAANDQRRKFTVFRFPLAASETVVVKLFYTLASNKAPAGDPELTLHGALKAGARSVTLESAPFRMDVLGDGI